MFNACSGFRKKNHHKKRKETKIYETFLDLYMLK